MKKEQRERNIQIKIYVNENEKIKIKNNMKKANKKNFSDYAREILTTGEIKITDFQKIKELRYEVNKVGNNINQIVKLAHENRKVDKTYLEEIIENQKELTLKISKIINNEIKKEKK